MDFKDRVKKAKEDVDKGGNYENLPLGAYNCKLNQAFVNKSKGGRNQTNFDWEVMEGEYTGKTHRSFHNLDHDVGLQIFIQDLQTMGEDASSCGNLEEVDALCKDLALKSPICTITLTKSKKGDFTNTKINDFLGLGSENPPEQSPGTSVPDVPQQATITVGAKYKYKVGDQVIVSEVKSIDYKNETLDFPFHKGIPLSDVLEPA